MNELEFYLFQPLNELPVRKAGEREFIPELTESERRAYMHGLLGLAEEERPEESEYDKVFFHDTQEDNLPYSL